MPLAYLDVTAVFVFGIGSTMRKLVFCLQWGLPIYGSLPVFCLSCDFINSPFLPSFFGGAMVIRMDSWPRPHLRKVL